MPAKITTFEMFLSSFKTSKLLITTNFSIEVEEQLRIFFEDYYITQNDKSSYPSNPKLNLYKFINHNVECDDWCGRLKKSKSMKNSLEKQILLYGVNTGTKKWNDYVEFHKIKNSYEYKNKKYGISKDEFDEFNKSRACTLKNLIKRHGEDAGVKKWDEYCERQRYTTTLKYFKETYGDEAGSLKYENYINIIVKNIYALNKRTNCKVSILEQNIVDYIKTIYENVHPQYIHEGQSEYISAFDIYIKDLNLLIEVNGDFWHMNPKIYKSDYINPISKLSAKHKWHLDKLKINKALSSGYNVEVIWEDEYNKRKNDLILEILEKYEKRNNE